MSKVTGKLQVYFEDPFWVGVFERQYDEKLYVCRVVFGAEPRDYEVLDYLLKYYFQLRFSPPVEGTKQQKERINPKRMQREAKKQVLNSGIGTKSQQALKLLQEENKVQRKIRTKAQKEEELERKYELRQKKRKEKHRGR